MGTAVLLVNHGDLRYLFERPEQFRKTKTAVLLLFSSVLFCESQRSTQMYPESQNSFLCRHSQARGGGDQPVFYRNLEPQEVQNCASCCVCEQNVNQVRRCSV